MGVGTLASAAQLAISWDDNSALETGFEIERTNDGVTFSQVGTVPANTTRFIDTDVSAGRSYWYRVRAFNSTEKSAYSNVTGGSVLQEGAAATSGRLMNLSARAIPAEGEGALFSGFVVSGGSKKILIRVIGPGLAAYTAAPLFTDPALTLETSGAAVASNDNWGGDDTLSAVFSRLGAFALPAGSKDAALLADCSSQGYIVRVAGSGSGMLMAEIYDADSDATNRGRMLNLSVRSQITPGEGVLIVGFVIGGNAPLRVLVRAVGPALASMGVSSALADPQLEVFRGSVKWNGNDNWGGTAELDAAFAATGAFRLPNPGSADAALVTLLPPGAYTVVVFGARGSSGVSLAEVYAMP